MCVDLLLSVSRPATKATLRSCLVFSLPSYRDVNSVDGFKQNPNRLNELYFNVEHFL